MEDKGLAYLDVGILALASCKIAVFVSHVAKGKHNDIKRLHIRLAGTAVAFNSNTDHGLFHFCLIGHVFLSLELIRMFL